MNAAPKLPKIDWIKILFLSTTPIIGIGGTAIYTWRTAFGWWMPSLFLSLYVLVGLSICAGYHRYFAHKSFECKPTVQYILAFFGAMAVQGPIVDWASGHRSHHKHADTDWDPYCIKRGFWWAHFLWIFYDPPKDSYRPVGDLVTNPVVCWQKRWYTVIAIVGGLGIPLLIGALCGDAIGGVLWGGFLRIVLIHHSTFFVNSLAHSFGSQEFDHELSARDNWLVALVTMGEGYHSFHHRFPGDYRNGARWYQWDPAKWFIASLKFVGLAKNLHFVSWPQIEKARILTALAKLDSRIREAPDAARLQFQLQLTTIWSRLEEATALWQRQSWEWTQGLVKDCRETRRKSLALVKRVRRDWPMALRFIETASAAS